MKYLNEHGEGYGRLIAREIDHEPGPVSAALQSLLSKELIEVSRLEPHNGGNPKKWVRLTAKGREHAQA